MQMFACNKLYFTKEGFGASYFPCMTVDFDIFCEVSFAIVIEACRSMFVKVLQQTADHELFLYSDVKEQSRPIAQVMIISLSSQPVDQEDRRPVPVADVGL